ncbi:MAG: spermidine/putrescine ABC transporter substrate-binding protein [Oscillatoriales cyanobacterium RM2_1_1]|nr:spermidine/putrescine ABC transporter substrate-binding protein [Oscillatoriales cyanobacterium SM2_3_0]NJO48002.1 spermidine/putrescine ABC transporter substrate-binding protein [Oscillatoriales cyanobacterium RM2_1_1]
MKKLFTLLLLFILGLTLPFGCTSSNSNLSNNNSVNSQVLNLYNWSTYIDPNVIAEFEQKNAVKVNYDTYDSNESLYAKIKSGSSDYDLAFPADYMVKIMVEEDLLEPLNRANIPNTQNLDQKFINPPYDPENTYSFPYQWGTLGIGYNLKATGQAIDSWEAMFNSKFSDKIAWLDDMRYTLGGVLMYLGYDPSTTNQVEIEKAKDFVITNQKTIAAFAPDTGQLLLNQGEVDLAMEYSGDIFQVMAENPDLRYAIPKEGTILWTDNMVIPKGAPHKDLAEKFINFVLEPEVGARISNFINYGSPNKAAIEQKLINPENLSNPGIYPPEDVFAKLKYLKDVGDSISFYDEAWAEIKLSIGS